MSDGSFISHASQYLCEVDQYYYNHYFSPSKIIKLHLKMINHTMKGHTHSLYYSWVFESVSPCSFNEIPQANGIKYDFYNRKREKTQYHFSVPPS